MRLSFNPDFSSDVQKRRASFTEVKRRLQKLQAPYAMLYPSRLRITARGQKKNLENAADAWLDANVNEFPRVRRQAEEEG